MAPEQGSDQDLENVIEDIREVADESDEVSVSDIQQTVGTRSFAPFLLIGGLIVLSPVGGIPGVPTFFGIIVLLTAGQLLIGRRSFWLPQVIANRAVDGDKLREGLDKLRGVAGKIDAMLKPRLAFLIDGPAVYGVAFACVALGAVLPALEAVPFAAAAPAGAITAFSLALVSKDGLLALLGYIVTGVSVYVLVTTLLL